jgi:hypothetical protein
MPSPVSDLLAFAKSGPAIVAFGVDHAAAISSFRLRLRGSLNLLSACGR